MPAIVPSEAAPRAGMQACGSCWRSAGVSSSILVATLALRQNAVGPADPVQTLRRGRISTWPVTPRRARRTVSCGICSYRYSSPTRQTAVAEALKHRAKHPQPCGDRERCDPQACFWPSGSRASRQVTRGKAAAGGRRSGPPSLCSTLLRRAGIGKSLCDSAAGTRIYARRHIRVICTRTRRVKHHDTPEPGLAHEENRAGADHLHTRRLPARCPRTCSRARCMLATGFQCEDDTSQTAHGRPRW